MTFRHKLICQTLKVTSGDNQDLIKRDEQYEWELKEWKNENNVYLFNSS